jgi:hypothetical protein
MESIIRMLSVNGDDKSFTYNTTKKLSEKESFKKEKMFILHQINHKLIVYNLVIQCSRITAISQSLGCLTSIYGHGGILNQQSWRYLQILASPISFHGYEHSLSRYGPNYQLLTRISLRVKRAWPDFPDHFTICINLEFLIMRFR